MINKFKVRFELKDNGNNTQHLYGLSYQNSVKISETNFGNIVDILNYKQENTNYKQALNEIRECCENNALEVNTREYGNLIVTNIEDILKIIEKILGGSDE